MTLQKFFYRNNYQYLERLRLTEQSIDLIRHCADPHAGAYIHELTWPQAVLWMSGSEQVTRIE